MNETILIAMTTAIVISTLFSVLSMMTVWKYKKQLTVHRKVINELRNNFRTLTSGSKGVGERMVKLEQKVRRLIDRLNHLELRESTKPFDQAIQMANKGDDIDELVAKCGMSQGEAELLVNLHGIKRAS
ncbi:MAG: DUF2802 domain-containing protein [Gammaproteobacteria bacterium]|nr:DUF2802 domain-containing protein [Gammaproteobacteria bacterium]MDH5614841.1 DUF2802 domain-containing protein [Gammaproteobacteria bacterium]